MARIRTIPPSQATGELEAAYERLTPRFPPEYTQPTESAEASVNEEGVTVIHSLLPKVMEPIMVAMIEMMSPELALTRRQHEMINTVVSRANACHY